MITAASFLPAMLAAADLCSALFRASMCLFKPPRFILMLSLDAPEDAFLRRCKAAAMVAAAECDCVQVLHLCAVETAMRGKAGSLQRQLQSCKSRWDSQQPGYEVCKVLCVCKHSN